MSDFSGPTEAGWQPDPDGRHEYRYWDGATWTDQVSDGGVVSTDPPGPSPTAVVPPTTVEQPVVPPAQPPVYGEQPPVYTGVPLEDGASGGKSGVPVGILALIGLVVAALVVGLVLFLTGGDDGGGDDGDEVAATSDVTDDASDDASDQSDDATSDFSDELTDDSSDDATSDFSDDFSDDFTDESGDSGDVVTANNLEDGDCVVDETTLTSSTVTPIDCSQPHVFELIGRFDVADGPFPGADQLNSQGQTRCTGQIFEDYVGIPYAQSVTYASALPPSQETWEQANDRTILCFAHTSDQSPTTGSVRNSGT